MGNSTTPLKAAIVGLLVPKAAVLLGIDAGQAGTLVSALLALVGAAVTYVLPADMGISAKIRELL